MCIWDYMLGIFRIGDQSVLCKIEYVFEKKKYTTLVFI